MPQVDAFHSTRELTKMPMSERRHHNNGACSIGAAIPANERKVGTTSGFVAYRLCEECERLNAAGS